MLIAVNKLLKNSFIARKLGKKMLFVFELDLFLFTMFLHQTMNRENDSHKLVFQISSSHFRCSEKFKTLQVFYYSKNV